MQMSMSRGESSTIRAGSRARPYSTKKLWRKILFWERNKEMKELEKRILIPLPSS